MRVVVLLLLVIVNVAFGHYESSFTKIKGGNFKTRLDDQVKISVAVQIIMTN